MISEEHEEILQTIETVQNQFEELVVRGLRTTDSGTVATLRSMQQEFERIGAMHLACRIGDLADTIEADDKTAASALMRAQTSLRLFERILTLEVVGDTLAAMKSAYREKT